MKKSQPKNTLTIILLILSSLVFVLLFIFSYLSAYSLLNRDLESADYSAGGEDRYYLNEDFINDDFFITKNPGLEDILKGPIVSSHDPGLGDYNSPITIVIFSDFACGFCSSQEQTLKSMLDKYDVRLIWKDYPEINLMSASFKAAIAARCAQRQDNFWPFHDRLYDYSGELNESAFYEIADGLGLNSEVFEECLDSAEARNMVIENIEEANALGITGVPFIYVNDQEILGEIDSGDLEKIIQAELNKTTGG